MTRALARVDQAKAIYSQSRARLVALRESEEGASGETGGDLVPDYSGAYEKSFGAMIREGFAYSLPLILLEYLFSSPLSIPEDPSAIDLAFLTRTPTRFHAVAPQRRS